LKISGNEVEKGQLFNNLQPSTIKACLENPSTARAARTSQLAITTSSIKCG